MGIGDQSPEVIEARRERPLSTDVHAPQSRFADLRGVRLHYLVAGHGDPVVLLHGYTQTSHMWRPLMAALANTHTVIAPDLRGVGQSSTPADGYTKAAMAQDIHALVRSLGHERLRMAGHDIGLMVAYAYARPGGMRAGFEIFRAFERDAEEFASFAQTPLPMPMLVLTGERASGEFLIEQGRLVATHVEGVIVRHAGHWLMEEAPHQVIPTLVDFLGR